MKNTVLKNLLNCGVIENSCDSYGEQGYELGEGKRYILLSNWNEFDSHPNFLEWLEENFELEWSDEWVIDYSTMMCYRTSPDSYGWEQQFRFSECGDLITPESDIQDWIDCSVNNLKTALPSFIDEDKILEQGFKLKKEGLENGFLRGMNDNPEAILDELRNVYEEVLFKLEYVSQFSLGFRVYVR